MRVGTKPTINNLAVEFATLLSIICNKNAFVNENKDSLKQKDENKKRKQLDSDLSDANCFPNFKQADVF